MLGKSCSRTPLVVMTSPVAGKLPMELGSISQWLPGPMGGSEGLPCGPFLRMKRLARDLGRRIAVQRRTAGLTQEDLAERAGVNVKTIQGVEQGRTEPELRTLTLLAKALNTSLENLVPGAGVGSAESIIKKVVAELHELPLPTLEHLAALVHLLAKRK